jgi:hypothetical protein
MEGMITRKVELKGIGAFSTFKIFFAITLVFTVISFVVFHFFGMQVMSYVAGAVGDVRQFSLNLQSKFPEIFQNEIVLGVASSVLIGVIVGLVTALSALIFSIFAVLLGGVKIRIREKNPEKKTTYL